MSKVFGNLFLLVGAVFFAASLLAMSSVAFSYDPPGPSQDCDLTCDTGCQEMSWYDNCVDPEDPDPDPAVACDNEETLTTCSACECQGGAGVHVCWCQGSG